MGLNMAFFLLVIMFIILAATLAALIWFVVQEQPEIKVTPYIAVKTGNKFLDDNR